VLDKGRHGDVAWDQGNRSATCPSLTVRSAGASIERALDGEVIRLESPLRFRIRAGALRAVAP